MRRSAILLALPAASLLAAACQTDVPMDTATRLGYGAGMPFEMVEAEYPLIMPIVPDGARVFETRCASCHSGEGASPDFSDPAWNWQKTPSSLYGVVAHGEEGHPAFGDRLSLVDVWDSIGYVWSLNMGTPDVRDQAALVFGENCSVCHGKTGFGNGPLSHKLDPKPQNFTDRQVMSEFTNEYLYFRISEGGQWSQIPESVRRTMPRAEYHSQQWSAMPAWQGVLTPDERRLIISHLRSLTIKLQH